MLFVIILVAAILVTVIVAQGLAGAAESGVASAIESTWDIAKALIKQVVVFPVINLVLAVLFFVKDTTAYMDYLKHEQFGFTAPAILLRVSYSQ